MPFDFAAQIEVWRKQLLDTTKRNRLIGFKAGRGAGVSLLHPDPGDLWHCLVGDDAGLTFVWKSELIDLPPRPGGGRGGRRFVPLRPAAAAAPAPARPTAQEILTCCRHSPRLRDDHLLTDLHDRPLAARLTRLALNARESLTEQGVVTLYVPFGFLRWFIGRFRTLDRRAVASAAARIRAYQRSGADRTAARRCDPSQQPRSMT
jgi:hypothetical protein